MPSWLDDWDLVREQREDMRRDTPDARELERMQRQSDEYQREIASRPVGTRIAPTVTPRKAA